ncbi:uncharacterized protein LODBEIA_P59710 [Lodderomyces beijingensis]|uniref:Uncharacterized protein n=1 Tax=Lodderomyces beijingensis TaxID=1775926 RepID=A0ABP0ZWX3_9ASCO
MTQRAARSVSIHPALQRNCNGANATLSLDSIVQSDVNKENVQPRVKVQRVEASESHSDNVPAKKPRHLAEPRNIKWKLKSVTKSDEVNTRQERHSLPALEQTPHPQCIERRSAIINLANKCKGWINACSKYNRTRKADVLASIRRTQASIKLLFDPGYMYDEYQRDLLRC